MVLALLVAPQVAMSQESLVTGLLTRAKNALNDLKYPQADSIARLIITLGDVVPRAQRIHALQIAAAARFPEDGAAQKPDSALSALKSIISMGHTDPIPFELGWVGLDSLYRQVGGSGQAPAAASSAAATDGAGPSIAETGAWLNDRVPQFVSIAWNDSTATMLSSASETFTAFNVSACTIKYTVMHRETDILLDRKNKKNAFKGDTAYTFIARELDPATFENGSIDLTMRLFGMVRGSKRSQVGFVRVTELAKPGRTPRRLDLSVQSGAQAGRVRNALERLVRLCQKEPF
jgi:hypothetical protein